MEGRLLNSTDFNSSSDDQSRVAQTSVAVVTTAVQQSRVPSHVTVQSVGVVVSPPTVQGFIATDGTDARPLAPGI